ncbi:MAG: Smr/MutS family protein [Desulfuromonadaceae bacterium]|nr:Smr/MutS family protein [Desulfuromonadaceae bacterium]
MSKKPNQNRQKPKEFHASPFGPLKGMLLPDDLPVQPEAAVVHKPEKRADSGLNLFLQAVADVKPIHKRDTKPATQDSHISRISVANRETFEAEKENDNDLFLDEIRDLKLDAKFADSVPDDGELKLISGNRLRQVKRGVVSVEYQLDLHGLTREEALTALPRFLRSARQKGQKAVLVIAGKGNHSTDAPVLQQAVASWLRETGRELVVEFTPAPRELGGSGAFVVFLRPGP